MQELGPILFDTNSSTLKSNGNQVVRKIAEILKKNPSRSISIIGHTDNIGNEEDNLRLSEKRVRAVEKLLKDLGVENQISVKWAGKNGASESDTAEERARKRRVDFKVE